MKKQKTIEHSISQSKGQMKSKMITSGLENDEILIGLLLSDAHLIKLGSNYQNSQFNLTQSIKNHEMIEFVEKYLHDLGFETNKSSHLRELGVSINLATKRYPDFTILRKLWYPEGIKIVPRNIKLTPKSTAFWFQGDGSSHWYARGNKKASVLFATDGFDEESVKYLKSELERLGINNVNYHVGTKLRKDGKPRPHLQIKKSSEVSKLMQMVKPFMLDCFMYKIKEPYVNSIPGEVPLWKISKEFNKCRKPDCTKTAQKGRLGCNDHKSIDENGNHVKYIQKPPKPTYKWFIDKTKRKCRKDDCNRTAESNRLGCHEHKTIDENGKLYPMSEYGCTLPQWIKDKTRKKCWKSDCNHTAILNGEGGCHKHKSNNHNSNLPQTIQIPDRKILT